MAKEIQQVKSILYELVMIFSSSLLAVLDLVYSDMWLVCLFPIQGLKKYNCCISFFCQANCSLIGQKSYRGGGDYTGKTKTNTVLEPENQNQRLKQRPDPILVICHHIYFC